MVTKIVKFLKKLSVKEREETEEVIISIKSKNWDHLDVKKLKGLDNLFRVRKGNLRIIFSVDNNSINLIDIQKRSDKTYSKY